MFKNKNIFVMLLLIVSYDINAQKKNAIPFVIDGGGSTFPTVTLKMGTGIYKEWMAYNLGADNNLVSNYPVKEIHGNYYQFGRIVAVGNASTSSAAITGWATGVVPDNAWNSGTESVPVKTSNDPCPTGFRIPTNSEWIAVGSNNIYAKIGNWTDSENNYYGAAILTNPDNPSEYMTLPSAGVRNSINGALLWRGENANYWSSTSPTGAGGAYGVNLTTSGADLFSNLGQHSYGLSVRCIKQ